MSDVFLKKNTLDFKPTDSQLEVNIESLEIHFYRASITGKFLYKKIFKNTKSIFMSGYVKHISLEAFKYLESIKLINLEYDIFKSTGVKYLQSLNLKFKNNSIFLPNHTIQICFGVYYFPDEDFCLFKDFPANQLLLVVPFSPNSNCSCLLFWLLDSYFYDHGLKFLENNSYCLNMEKMFLCQFEKKILSCQLENFREKKHKILVDYIYESEVIVLLTVYLIPVIGILSIVLNSCNIVVVLKIQNDKEKNLKEIKKSFYQWILLNSSIYILYSMISLFHPISICIFQNGIYCSFFSRSTAIQYYEIYVYDFFGGILKTVSNFLSINVAFQRYLNLVSNKKNFFRKISNKNLFLIVFFSAFLINIDKILTSEVNRDLFDINNSQSYPEFPYRNTFKGIFDADSPHQDRNVDLQKLFNKIAQLNKNKLIPLVQSCNDELFSTLVYESTNPIDKEVNVAYDRIIKSYAAASSIAIPNQAPRARKRPNHKWFNHKIKQIKLAVRNAICMFETSIVRVCKLQPKLLYNYINSQKQCRDSIKGLLDCHGAFHTDGYKIVNIFNVQFDSVFIPHLSCSAQPLQLTGSPQHDMNVDFFSPINVRKYTMRLNDRKSPDMDGIHPYVV
ncbi:hypothetical protein BpHYR1_014710 [Brachionus plicatilis]|uniref:Uncharacterized protein n=1 Tax=Brachionus plicatilis TaxID=10195 RepID=A0A3M7RFA3_BRAPC|nr:hypothetical protein BpHYR1_014710 [Brachionus plicatilis]